MEATSEETVHMPLAVQKMFTNQSDTDPASSLHTLTGIELEDSAVLICCGPKCGTTWMQQIVHGLRSRGDMSFEEIIEVMPVLERVLNPAYPPLDTPQPFPPRVFKTHCVQSQLPKGQHKQIVVTRNPQDAIVSFYHFYANTFFDPAELSLDEFVEWMVIQNGAVDDNLANALQLRHLVSFYPHRKDENVLWLHYEDLKEDLSECVRLVSNFLQIGVGDEELLKLVKHQATFEFMKKHKSRFDGHTVKRRQNEMRGMPVEQGAVDYLLKIRNGEMNEGARVLTEDTKRKMLEKWKSFVEPVTGYGSYEDMRRGINTELGRSFASSMPSC